MAQPPERIFLKASTKISLNDRFSNMKPALAPAPGASQQRTQVIQRTLPSAAPSVQSVRQQALAEQHASIKNRRLAMQMANRPAVQAALKIKQRVLRQRLGARARLQMPQAGSFRGQRGGLRFFVGYRGVQQIPPRFTTVRGNIRRLRGTGGGARGGGGGLYSQQTRVFSRTPRGRRGLSARGRSGTRGTRGGGDIGYRGAGRGGGRGRGRGRGGGQARGRGLAGRSRGGRGGRARGRGGRGGGSGPSVSKESLDNQLDAYMKKTTSALDSELDTYMKDANVLEESWE